MQFRSFEPGIEVYGVSINAIVGAFKLFPSIPQKRLAAHGIGVVTRKGEIEIDVEAWYPQQSWLDAFRDIANSVGPQALFQIGQQLPKHAVFPPSVNDMRLKENFHTGIASIDVAYHMNHRKNGVVMFDPRSGTMLEGIGHYGYQASPGKVIRSVCENPYPCEFDQGIITAIAQRFDKRALVEHDADAACRKKNGESCTYVVTW
jgi:hypothetical protein